MKKLHFALTLILSGILLSGNSQEFTYDISKYKLPDYKRSQLDLNYSFDLNNTINSTEYIDGGSDYNNTYHSINNNLSANYQLFENTKAFQKWTSGGIQQIFNYSSDESSNSNYTFTNVFSTIWFGQTKRNYRNNENFSEVGFQFNGGHVFQKNKHSYSNTYSGTTYYYEEKQQTYGGFLTLPLKAGAGRIEEVQDARQAIYILRELQNIQALDRTIIDDDVEAFAQLITQLKKERFFDNRIHKIKELTAVDSFLQTKNLKKDSDIRYFSVLNDNWDYGRTQIRYSGRSVQFYLTPGLGYTYTKFRDKFDTYLNDDTEYIYPSLQIGIDIKGENPMSEKWQASVELNAGIGILQERIEISEQITTIPRGLILFEHTLGYFPNTRTDFSFGYFVSFSNYLDDLKNTNNKLTNKGGNTGTQLSWNYYISPKLRLNANWNFSLEWHEGDHADYETLYDIILSDNALMESTSYFRNKKLIDNTLSIKFIYSIF